MSDTNHEPTITYGLFLNFGIGRGGYLKDYEVLDVDTARWQDEPVHSARVILQAWADPDMTQPHHSTGPSTLQPPPLTQPHPPLLMATQSPLSIRFAAERRLPLQHYFAAPVEQRVAQEAAYAEVCPDDGIAHLHTLIVCVDDDAETARGVLADALTESFAAGDWPHVPGGGHGDHTDDADDAEARRREDRSKRARAVATEAIIGPAAEVADALDAYCRSTGARLLALYVEAIADADRIAATLDGLAGVVTK